MLLEISLGLIIAALLIYFSSNWHPRKQLKLWCNSLIIAALIYIGFASFNGAWDALPIELLGVLGYGSLALLGYRYSPLFLVVGWGLHVLWDIIIHAPPSEIAPTWYPGACFGFDLMIAGYLGYLIWRRNSERKTKSATSD